MNLLIAYDGSKCAEAAIDDLVRAGLPAKGSAHVVSVAEIFLPPRSSTRRGGGEPGSPYIEEIVDRYRERGEKAVAEAAIMARHAVGRVRAALPKWRVTSAATYGSPAWEIIEASEQQGSDLIVVGSQGQSALGRFFLGSISQKVLAEAACSVRVARGRIEVEKGHERIVVGFDGSKGSVSAVDSVAARAWHEGTEVRLIAVTEPVLPSTIGRFVPPITRMVEEVNATERIWIESTGKPALARLRSAGLSAEIRVCPGNPKQVLIEEAERWGADCVFVGANAWGSRLERALVGSTSAAVAARAHCSVEVVRAQSRMPKTQPGEAATPNGKRA
jgi:nucleotide-binding universal stress UspA family protein